MYKKLLFCFIAAVMTVVSSGCSSLSEGISSAKVPGQRWVDSDLMDVDLSEDDIRLQDDFAAAVNRDWKLAQTGERKMFSEISDTVISNKKKIVTDPSLDDSYAGELIRNYYSLASNWDDRNSDGVEPIRKYIEDIESITDTDELLAFIFDSKRNPLGMGPLYIAAESVQRSSVYKDRYYTALTSPTLLLGSKDAYFKLSDNFESYEDIKDILVYYLDRLGMEDDRIERLISDGFSYERMIAEADTEYFESDKDATHSKKELISYAGKFPMEEYLTAKGMSDNDVFVCSPKYIGSLYKLCDKSCIDKAKAFLMIRYIYDCRYAFDEEGLLFVDQKSASRWDKDDIGDRVSDSYDELIFDEYIGNTAMVGPMNQLYVKYFFDESTVDELEGLTEEIIAEAKAMFDEEEWLSDEGKRLCREKADAIGIHVAKQDYEAVDYSGMELIKRESGGNFLEAYLEASRFMGEHMAWLSHQKVDKSYWDPLSGTLSTTITNAMYYPLSNSIYIFAGVCEAPAYDPELSYEQKLAGIGTIVGHEITHAFDDNGANYNKNGDKETWMPSEDLLAFSSRSFNVSTFYSTLTPYISAGSYNGSMIVGEAIADMGGLKLALRLAKKDPDFDYDLFFKSYAGLWKAHVSLEYEQKAYKEDVHPLPFYRANVGLAQFDEFYETYGIKESDNMYVAPEDRINVW